MNIKGIGSQIGMAMLNKLSIDEIRSFSDQSLLSIPKSKDTLLSLFFGEKFSKTISNWGKERK